MASTKITMTVPAPMLKAADRIAAAEYRTRAEVFREALREYIVRRSRGAGRGVADEGGRYVAEGDFERAAAAIPLDDEPYTRAQRRDVARAKAAMDRGEQVSLDALKDDLAARIAREQRRVDRPRRRKSP